MLKILFMGLDETYLILSQNQEFVANLISVYLLLAQI